MVRPWVLVVLPLMLATLLIATTNAQNYIEPAPSPLPDSPSPPPPPPPEPSTAPPPASTPTPAGSSPPPPAPPASSPPPPPSPASFLSPPPPAHASNWTPVANTNDPKIQQVAQFAVRIYAISKKELKMQFQNVVSGETQPCDGGYNYRLVITVRGGKKAQYDAFVWGIHRTTSWKLLSFTPKY
ncbi:Cysteine proteinase inhibitor 5 [Zea mays]|uniref:Cysteine proteinase inhibitor 5 n=1 Tax=Zea mays TaxID=4577 RepID=A0A3L6DFJ3_MAIZE|nr:Cysteine proteinase inhibitor 5 [Zea mays]